MNRLQDCFDDDNAGGEIGTGPLFQGMRHDPSVPLNDFAARHFSPALARWIDQENKKGRECSVSILIDWPRS